MWRMVMRLFYKRKRVPIFSIPHHLDGMENKPPLLAGGLSPHRWGVIEFNLGLLSLGLVESEDMNARVARFKLFVFSLSRRYAVVRRAHRWAYPARANA
jgi:hypothetical protein